jgi:tRNA G46 methylase TrmB
LRAHTREAFEQTATWLKTTEHLILDAGCGSGESTLALARRYPEARIIGIDKSMHRLGQPMQSFLDDRVRLLRAEWADFCRLMQQHDIRATHLYLLYPNPWPKKQHLKRRWHGHPIWPDLLGCAESITLRTNWSIYAEEFSQALLVSGCQQISLERLTPDGLTPFERKYAASGHRLWQVRASLDPPCAKPYYAH